MKEKQADIAAKWTLSILAVIFGVVVVIASDGSLWRVVGVLVATVAAFFSGAFLILFAYFDKITGGK